MQRPCTIRPGSPTLRANSSSRWIAKWSPDALGVASGLVVGDGVGDLRERGLAVYVERMSGRALADALGGLDAAEELGHVLLADERAGVGRASPCG